MSTPSRAGDRDDALEELRLSMSQLFGAQRRLRGRDARIETGVSFAHFPLLRALLEEGELSAGQLATKAGITPATVTQMLESLSGAGLVERQRSERDRRVVTTRLTDEGRERVERKQEDLNAKWRESLDGLDSDELKAATRVVERISAYLDEL